MQKRLYPSECALRSGALSAKSVHRRLVVRRVLSGQEFDGEFFFDDLRLKGLDPGVDLKRIDFFSECL